MYSRKNLWNSNKEPIQARQPTALTDRLNPAALTPTPAYKTSESPFLQQDRKPKRASHDKTFVFKEPTEKDPSTGYLRYLHRNQSGQHWLLWYYEDPPTCPVPQWVTEFFELDTSLSTLSPSPPPSPTTPPFPASSPPPTPYPSPPLSPLFHTPPSSPLASPTTIPSPINMAAAVPTFSGGMKENGWDWLKEIKAHFADAQMSIDAARCEYSKLKLCADTARQFKELPEATCTDWKLLKAEWKQMYPSRNTYHCNTKDIDEFYDLRITDSDLAKRSKESNEGNAEWAIAQFLERLRYLGTKTRTNRALRPIANNVTHTADSSKNGNPTVNKSFDANPERICQYEDTVNRWFATYGADAVPNTSRPFPLTPGSPSPGSGECWRCGHKGHYKGSAECLRNNPLPNKEQQYRRIVRASILNAV
ncbi:hypothetical protein M422DRAFT_254122 [Sphaerobolus stellatus SS14]|uniref:Uncharacterized protein n=1 Tax=Sphaerobolus stellatus (strain SS14) TaxID=990650 RepID=A0A0C9VWH6_SPHS4|nr:hypothetical protein M422DRAFT_254122 [Sphaerobolus stellatus SS14]